LESTKDLIEGYDAGANYYTTFVVFYLLLVGSAVPFDAANTWFKS